VLGNLLAKCYRLVRLILASEPDVAPVLEAVEENLLETLSSLQNIRFLLSAVSPSDVLPFRMEELRDLQEFVNHVDSARVDGKFLDPVSGEM
jgi:hypothetical protein